MDEALFSLSEPENEPIRSYRPGSANKANLKARLGELAGQELWRRLIPRPH